jgi:hypothetical protein
VIYSSPCTRCTSSPLGHCPRWHLVRLWAQLFSVFTELTDPVRLWAQPVTLANGSGPASYVCACSTLPLRVTADLDSSRRLHPLQQRTEPFLTLRYRTRLPIHIVGPLPLHSSHWFADVFRQTRAEGLWRVGANPVPQSSRSSSPISHSVPTPAHHGQASTGSPRTFLLRASQSWSTSWPRFASHFIKTVFYFGTLNFGNALSLVRCAHTPSSGTPS